MQSGLFSLYNLTDYSIIQVPSAKVILIDGRLQNLAEVTYGDKKFLMLVNVYLITTKKRTSSLQFAISTSLKLNTLYIQPA